MILYRTRRGAIVDRQGQQYLVPDQRWDDLVNDEQLVERLSQIIHSAKPLATRIAADELLPPVESQEIWAAGVTYLRSRTARMEESAVAGGGSFYDRVYHADRPELFFKANAHRTAGTGQAMHLRSDSKWIVPEPELTLVITRTGQVIGYTIGNDLSCRDIEGENPLYLPQAKTFRGCAAVGPGIRLHEGPLDPATTITMEIGRGDEPVFRGETTLSQMKKTLPALVEYLFRDNTFPDGCLLMTGTGIVPPDDFSLQVGDEVRITIAGIGTLVNTIA